MSASPPRSLLFVSAEKSGRFSKALVGGADLVCVDLEDAVHAEAKSKARADVIGWLGSLSAEVRGNVAVRINGLSTLDGLQDVLALSSAADHPGWLMLPKVEHASELQLLAAWLPSRNVRTVALIETPTGVENVFSIARAGGALAALMLGGADLCAELGVSMAWESLHHARGRMVNAAKAAGIQAWDVPHLSIADAAAIEDETRRVLALGYDCKAAIHPRQLSAIHAAFRPSSSEVAWAMALTASAPSDLRGAFSVDGQMVDAPVLRRARQVLARAAQPSER